MEILGDCGQGGGPRVVQAIAEKGAGPAFIPYWQVDTEQARPIAVPYSSTSSLEFILNSANLDSYDRFRIARTLKGNPGNQLLLLEDTQAVREKILEHAWPLHRGLSSDLPGESPFIQDHLFSPWEELEKLPQSQEPFAQQAHHILELRQAIHQLKVIALKRGEGPGWVQGQIHWVCQADPYLAMLLLPVLHSASTVPNDPVARLQEISFRKGYQLFFGPVPRDPLLGRPEFLALRWIQEPYAPEKLRPQWGVLSEDGFFNTHAEGLQGMTRALGLYTLPEKKFHKEFLHYARVIRKMHEEIDGKRYEKVLPLMETAQVTAQSFYFAIDPSCFYRWRAMASPPKPTESRPVQAPLLIQNFLPEEQRTVRGLECDFPMWPNLREDLCLAFFDQSGKTGVFDGQDQWGSVEENHGFKADPDATQKNLKMLGLDFVPSGTPYSAMDKYARHFNRAYQIASGKTFIYPSNSLHQVVEDLRAATGVAVQYRMPLNLDRYRRVAQDALMLFWASAPALFSFKYTKEQAPSNEKVGLLFTAHQELIEKERQALGPVARLLSRDKSEVLNLFYRIGMETLENQMHNENPKAPVRAQYAIRLLLDFIPAKELEGLVAPMRQLAQQSAERGEPGNCHTWLTSVDMLLQPLGKRVGKSEFKEAMDQAHLNQKTQSPATPGPVDASAAPNDR